MIYRILVAPARPVDDEGAPLSGYIPVGLSEAGVYLDTVPDAPLPDGAIELASGPGRYAALADTPHADAVLRARVVREIDGEPVELRIPQGEVQPGDEVLETGLAAQRWYGE